MFLSRKIVCSLSWWRRWREPCPSTSRKKKSWERESLSGLFFVDFGMNTQKAVKPRAKRITRHETARRRAQKRERIHSHSENFSLETFARCKTTTAAKLNPSVSHSTIFSHREICRIRYAELIESKFDCDEQQLSGVGLCVAFVHRFTFDEAQHGGSSKEKLSRKFSVCHVVSVEEEPQNKETSFWLLRTKRIVNCAIKWKKERKKSTWRNEKICVQRNEKTATIVRQQWKVFHANKKSSRTFPISFRPFIVAARPHAELYLSWWKWNEIEKLRSPSNGTWKDSDSSILALVCVFDRQKNLLRSTVSNPSLSHTRTAHI